MRYFITTILLFFAGNILAQQISGVIMETKRKPLGFATVVVYNAMDTTIITYRLSAPNGEFKIPGLPQNTRMRLLITHTGFEAYRKEFELNAVKPTLHLDTLQLKRSLKMLDELLITAELPPVVFKKDTIEFNASAFKTLPNALVEDLLKKLPGVDVDRDGNIAVEGKAVNRITVDGKSFFGDDPRMATRNLPANIISKVQVTDDKDEMIRRGDDNPNNVGKVINLTFKKGVKKGWFGKVYGGAGNDNLYTAGAIANIYRDTLQLSILAHANNINKAPFSFTELLSMGGFQRTRSTGAAVRNNVWRTGTGTGISLDNVNFGGAQGIGGISISRGTGFNLNHSPNKKRSFYLQYFYNKNNSNTREVLTNLDQFKADTVVSTSSRMTGPRNGNRHNMAAGMRLKPDSVTNISLNTAFMHAFGKDNQLTNISILNNKLGALSSGIVDQFADNHIYTYKHNIIATRLSEHKRGRRFTIGHDVEFKKNVFDIFSNSTNHFVYPSTFDTTIGQLRKERNPSTDVDVYFNYSEPLNKSYTIRFNTRYDYSRYDNNILTNNYNVATKKYDLFNSLFTNDLVRKNNQFTSFAGLEYKWKDLTVTPGVKWRMQRISNIISSIAGPLIQKQTNLLPTLIVLFRSWSFNYDRSINLPSYNNLVSVPDNTNPYAVTVGNPTLLPERSDDLNFNFRKNYQKRQLTINFTLYSGFTANQIVPSVVVDNHGISTSKAINESGGRDQSAFLGITKLYKSGSKFNFSLNVRSFYASTSLRFHYNNASSKLTNNSLRFRYGFNMNINDKLEWTSSYEVNFNNRHYTNPVFKNIDLTYQTSENEFIIRYPKHFIWESNVLYLVNPPSEASAFIKKPLVWNAAVNYTMLKNERGVLKLEANDILKSYDNVSVNASRNSVSSTMLNSLSHYFLLSFTYNIQTIGEKKKVGGWRLLLF